MAIKYMMPSTGWALNATPTENSPEAASQTYKKGAVLVASSGVLSEGGTNPTGIVGVSVIAGQNNGSSGAAITQYCPAIPGQLFEATLDDSTASPYTSAASDLYAQYGLTKDLTTGAWYVDHSKTSANARVTIVRFKDPVGTPQARVLVAFMQSKNAFQ